MPMGGISGATGDDTDLPPGNATCRVPVGTFAQAVSSDTLYWSFVAISVNGREPVATRAAELATF